MMSRALKAIKLVTLLTLVYVGIVVLFEFCLGYFQPQNELTLDLITSDENGDHERVLTQIDCSGRVYVAVNHRPRAWYQRAISNPVVSAVFNDTQTSYTATPITNQDEFDALNAVRARPPLFLLLTGFPPRKFLRPDPIASVAGDNA